MLINLKEYFVLGSELKSWWEEKWKIRKLEFVVLAVNFLFYFVQMVCTGAVIPGKLRIKDSKAPACFENDH